MHIMKAFRLRRYRDYDSNCVTVTIVSAPYVHTTVEAFVSKKILKD